MIILVKLDYLFKIIQAKRVLYLFELIVDTDIED